MDERVQCVTGTQEDRDHDMETIISRYLHWHRDDHQRADAAADGGGLYSSLVTASINPVLLYGVEVRGRAVSQLNRRKEPQICRLAGLL